MPKAKEVTFSVPGWLSVKFTPNEAEQIAAWKLYVELATRVATQPMDRSNGSMRAVLDSLYSIFTVTRTILRDGGPELASHPNSFGPLAIRFLTEVLAPFLLRWHEALKEHEAKRAPSSSVREHELAWAYYGEMSSSLLDLQAKTAAYVASIAAIADIVALPPPSATGAPKASGKVA